VTKVKDKRSGQILISGRKIKNMEKKGARKQVSVQQVYNAVLEMDDELVVKAVKAEIDNGTDASVILNKGLISAMDEIGKRFSEGTVFVPEMMMAAQAMKAGVAELKPLMQNIDTKSSGTIVIGTVKDDLHDIGKNLVAMMLESGGFNVIDLGVDVETEKFLTVAKDNNADIICMSALLTTTMPAMQEVVDAIKEAGLDFKTMVGGAPVTQEFADQIGATGYSADAPGAVEKARKLIG
jgi:5-methyltetrahydrofolate--homocysteine methyltransferase